MRVLGATVQVGKQYSGEWETVRRKCWQAFYLRHRFRRVRGFATARIRMLHLAIYSVLSWCAGSRYWNRRELKEVRTMQLRI